MAVSQQTWIKVRLWRAFLLVTLTAVGGIVWLIYAIVTHNSDLSWAASLYLCFLGLPNLVGVIITLRRDPWRSQLFKRGTTAPTADAEPTQPSQPTQPSGDVIGP